jgi:hypothetical protein
MGTDCGSWEQFKNGSCFNCSKDNKCPFQTTFGMHQICFSGRGINMDHFCEFLHQEPMSSLSWWLEQNDLSTIRHLNIDLVSSFINVLSSYILISTYTKMWAR